MNQSKLEELRNDPLFLQLTDKQRTFVEAYITSNGDTYAAVGVAYPCQDRHAARSMAGQLMRHETISVLLSRFNGTQISREQYLAMLWRELHRRSLDDGSKAQLFKLFAQVSGFDKPELVAEPTPAAQSQQPEPVEVPAQPAKFLERYEE
jgi:hypothetical protein